MLLSVFTGCHSGSEKLFSGERVDLNAPQGQWVLVNYWASWCGPCVKEVPALNAVSEDGAIRVLGVNYDNLQGEALRAAMDSLSINYDQFLSDPAPGLGVARPQVLPATFLISPSGALVTTLVGPQSQEGLRQTIQQYSSQ